ncbi:hypothetical protein BDC45DRAFT_505073 [Circinella umbellata]|nr:hypothetical protein BDC45DRAFT_505073 [Circinella umbellata]
MSPSPSSPSPVPIVKTVPFSVPAEILGVIARALPAEDWYACILVNKEWSIEFTSIFYRSVTIQTDRQCALFYDALLESSRRLGYYTRELCILAPDPPLMMLKELSKLCPFLTQLDLPHNIRGHIYDLAALPLSFASLSSLSYLCVTSNLADFSWLESLSQLTYLSIQWVSTEWSMEFVTDLHAWCPQLQSLQLIIKSISMRTKPISSSSRILHRDLVLNQHHKHHRQQQSDDSNKTTALTVRSVKIYLPVELVHPLVADWLDFCATTYPNLKNLTIGLEIGHELMNHQRINPFAFNNNVKNILLSSMSTFAQSCHYLKSIELENFGEYYRLLQIINRYERRLERIEIKDPYELVAWTLFAESTKSSKDSLNTLSIASFRDFLPGIEYGLLQHVQTLTNLSRLTLTDCMNRISIDKLLHAAPKLKYLCLVATYLVTTTTTTPFIEKHDSLEILEFRRNSVSQPVLRYINQHCHRLRQLSIECTSIPPMADDINQESYISLPNLNLQKITLRGVSRKTVIPDVDSFIGVKKSITMDSFKWYHTGKDTYENEKSRGVLGYSELPRYTEELVLKVKEDNVFVLLINCRSLQQLYFNDIRMII